MKCWIVSIFFVFVCQSIGDTTRISLFNAFVTIGTEHKSNDASRIRSFPILRLCGCVRPNKQRFCDGFQSFHFRDPLLRC